MPRSPMLALPPPDAVEVPLAGDDGRLLPFEPDPGPDVKACRRCRRVDGRLEAELLVAGDVIRSLEELLGWMRDEVTRANGARELVEAEAQVYGALVREYETIASSHDLSLRRTRRALAHGRKTRDEAIARAGSEEARASRLAAELKRAKDTRTAARPGTATMSPAAPPPPAVARRAEAEDALELALAACGAQETDSRVLELEGELRHERAITAKFGRYVAALEERLKSLADAEMVESSFAAEPAPF